MERFMSVSMSMQFGREMRLWKLFKDSYVPFATHAVYDTLGYVHGGKVQYVGAKTVCSQLNPCARIEDNLHINIKWMYLVVRVVVGSHARA